MKSASPDAAGSIADDTVAPRDGHALMIQPTEHWFQEHVRSSRTSLGGSPTSSVVGILHDKLVYSRRAQVLSAWFAYLVPERARILDVGCGDGQGTALLQSRRPEISVWGLEVLPRSRTYIPVETFDGLHIPFDDGSFDWVLFSDVLHHTKDARRLLCEARRVASQGVLIKDHYAEGFAALARLRLMDWVGNRHLGGFLPTNYWSEQQWQAAWREIGLEPEQLVTRLGLYPGPADWVFGARLHFVAQLRKCVPIPLPTK